MKAANASNQLAPPIVVALFCGSAFRINFGEHTSRSSATGMRES
jgi:hypothetical protein